MLQNSKLAILETARAGRVRTPRLNPRMACDTAFRIIAHRHLVALHENHEATCAGDMDALHQMRVALTHLRTDIRLFSPMVEDATIAGIKDGLKWLSNLTGTTRDLDVAVERIRTVIADREEDIRCLQSWEARRSESRRELGNALRSARYRRLIEETSAWIESGPWSIRRGKSATGLRATPVAAYAAGRLAEWEKKLLKRSRKLRDLSTERRHRLRLFNKRLTYSIQSLEDLFSDKRFSEQKIALKYLKKAQRCLGELNDDANGHTLAAALKHDGVETPFRFLGPKREKRLLKTAAAAYARLAALAPFQN
jgi:CHAD domain-containing protein